MPVPRTKAKIMASGNRYDGIHPKVVTIIRREARKLSQHPVFRWAEPADFEQELALHVLDRMNRHDSGRADLPIFLHRVIRNHTSRMLERETTAMRGGPEGLVSLNSPVMDEDGNDIERIDIIPEDQGIWAGNSTSWVAAIENRLEAEKLLSLLPFSLRHFVIRISFESITSVSQTTGVPRPTLYDALARARQCIRKKIASRPDVFRLVPVLPSMGM